MNTFVRYTLLSLLAAFLGFASCKENPTEPAKGEPPTNDQTAFYPLYIGNTWAYTDSIFYENAFVDKRLTVMSITDFSVESGQVWWDLSIDENVISVYSAIGDSIYSKFEGLLFFPASQQGDTLIYKRVVDSVFVYPSPQSISVPAGTFDSVVVFDISNSSRYRYIQYFKPRVGVLRYELYNLTNGFLEFTKDLVYYEIIQ